MDPPPNTSQAGKKNQFQVGAFRSLELVHVDRILLQLDNPKVPGVETDQPGPGQPPSHMQVTVTCRGPFRYDFPSRTAWFQDHVQAIHSNAEGPDDQLACDRLSAYFSGGESPRDEARSGDIGQRVGLSGSKVQRIEATGSPVVVDAPSYSAAARAERLEYNFETREVRIEDSNKAMLRYKGNEVETPRIEYRFGEEGRIGQMRADGPGRLTGSFPDDPSRTFEAVWKHRVILQPHKGDHALSLLAGAAVRVHDVGEFSANNVHIWIRETAVPSSQEEKKRFRYDPVRVLAEEQVRVDSLQLTGRTERAEIWIRHSPAVAAKKRAPGAVASGRQPPPETEEEAGEAPSRRRFDVAANHLQAQLFRSDKEMLVEHLIADGDVRFSETQTEKPGEIPIAIRGQIVQVDHANTRHARVRVQGEPARVSARGLELVGGNLQLNRGDNRLWVAGPGQMILPPRQPPEAASDDTSLGGLGATGPVSITWKESMEFDGLRARFHRDVEVVGTQISKSGEVSDLKVNGQDLGVTLTHCVQFDKDKQPPGLGVREMKFEGEVLLQNSTRQGGQQTSIERMRARDLTIDGATGRLSALGPGWGSTVRHGSSLSAGRSSPPGDAPQDAELVYVRVDFDGQVTGSAVSRELEFDGRTNTIYGPVAAWDQVLDPDPAGGLGKEQFLLTSDRLTVADMDTNPDDDQSAVELVADGNATIEGSNFSARGSRISYVHAKQLIVLDGDGRNDAELWMRGSRTPDFAAQQIRYWAGSDSIQVDGGRFLNLTHIGSSSGLLRQ
jgi:lipopolysaccharide export system protein LptA